MEKAFFVFAAVFNIVLLAFGVWAVYTLVQWVTAQ